MIYNTHLIQLLKNLLPQPLTLTHKIKKSDIIELKNCSKNIIDEKSPVKSGFILKNKLN